ncbi:hypothetical protein [Paracoccus sp. (in: a-proteobacteria)]|uniref:hypothetical protein n=1 Tax=Paracoccus sp. TaxID=267 RepID=UPI002729AC16|nr:hypothetical protein [Paracoccus sp. (in: a-proteobacteria)]
MLRAYAAAGYDPAQFWGLTPRLYLAHMRGASDRMERKHKSRAWLAWNVAGLTRVEKMPDFDAFISGDAGKVEKSAQTAMRLATLRASLPTITQEEWRARFST